MHLYESTPLISLRLQNQREKQEIQITLNSIQGKYLFIYLFIYSLFLFPSSF